MAFRKTKNLKTRGTSDKNGGKNVRSVKQKVQSKLTGRPKQKKQMAVKNPAQKKQQNLPTPPQRRDYVAKATKTVDYKKHRPFDDHVLMDRIKAVTGTKGKSTGKAKVDASLWPNNTTA